MSDLPTRAESIATQAHANQKYGTGPYTDHLEAVVNVLKEFGHHSEELLGAAWLHDVLEDTDCTPWMILSGGIPLYVLALVDAVTDRPGKNRAERHALTYPRIARIPDAVTLKLADRLANVRASAECRPDLLKMYAREQPEFIAAMPFRECDRGMRDELEEILSGVTA
jgi:(p)ppGpp synthase/HD superfamily hydrolase